MEEHYHDNRTNTRNKTIELSPDIIEEILIRLPIKSLLRFRCVCKEWKSLIGKNNFIKAHMNRAISDLVEDDHFIRHLNITTTTPICQNADLFGRYRGLSILAVSEGLVVEYYYIFCRSHSIHSVIIRNPATQNICFLPPPPSEIIRGMWLNIDSSTGLTKAKLLCEFSFLDVRTFRFVNAYGILKVGEENWRPLNPDRVGQSLMVSRDQKEMFFIKTRPHLALQISSFDIRTERSVNIDNFPQGAFSDLANLTPFWWNNSLAIGEVTGTKLHVLILEKQQNGNNGYKWSDQKIIIPLGVLGPQTIKDFVPIEAISNYLWFHSKGAYKYCYEYSGRTLRFKTSHTLKNKKKFEYRPSHKALAGMKHADPNFFEYWCYQMMFL